MQCAGAAQHLFLGARAAEKAAAGMDTVGEVQRQHPLAGIGQPPGRRQRRLVGDLDPGLREAGGNGAWKLGVGWEAALGGKGMCDQVPPIDGATLGVSVDSGLGGGDRHTTQLCRAVPLDGQNRPAAYGAFVRIQARQ
jgi:hypothetical protein